MAEYIYSTDPIGEGEYNHTLVGELVRCGECKWWGEERSIAFPDNHICYLHMSFSTTAIDYCSGGERREDG